MDETEVDHENSNTMLHQCASIGDHTGMGLRSEQNVVVDRKVQHSIDFKFFISELAYKYNQEHISKAFKINIEDIDEWRKRGDLLRQAYHEKYELTYNDNVDVPRMQCIENTSVDINQTNEISQPIPNSKHDGKPEDVTSSDIRKKSSYNTEFKLKAVEFAEMSTNRAAAKHFNVHDKRIREWRKMKEMLMSSPKDRKRLRGGGRPLVKDNLEPLLFEWILMTLKDGKPITLNEVQEKTTEMSVTVLPPGNKFIAYKHWVERFLKRHNLILIDNVIHYATGTVDNIALEGFPPPTMVTEDLSEPSNHEPSVEDTVAYLNT